VETDIRAALEAVAYGEDDRITPSDRLTALKQLQALGPASPAADLLAGLSDGEVDARVRARIAKAPRQQGFRRWSVSGSNR
jgi:hypothetical protein